MSPKAMRNTSEGATPPLEADERGSEQGDEGDLSTSYRDYSRVAPDAPNGGTGTMSLAAQGRTKEPTFPVKLHMILSNPEFQDIITWLPHGRSWRILQQKAFEERVIPLYFRHGRYSSFARQVNGWGFRRVTHGSDYNSYYHELFLRGKAYLCDRMRRLTSKDDLAKNRKGEDGPAPDFYELSRQNPLPENTPAQPKAISSGTPVSSNPGLNNASKNIMDQLSLLTGSKNNEENKLFSTNNSLASALSGVAGLTSVAGSNLGPTSLTSALSNPTSFAPAPVNSGTLNAASLSPAGTLGVSTAALAPASTLNPAASFVPSSGINAATITTASGLNNAALAGGPLAAAPQNAAPVFSNPALTQGTTIDANALQFQLGNALNVQQLQLLNGAANPLLLQQQLLQARIAQSGALAQQPVLAQSDFEPTMNNVNCNNFSGLVLRNQFGL